MSKLNMKSAGAIIFDKLLIGLIVLIFTIAGNIYSDKRRVENEAEQKQRELVVEKTAEIWKSIIAYKVELDKVSALRSEKRLADLFNQKLDRNWDSRMKKMELDALSARKSLDRAIQNNSFYIGPLLVQKATIYETFLPAYYEQSDQIKNSDQTPDKFSLEMLEGMQNLLAETSPYLSMDGAYIVRSSTER